MDPSIIKLATSLVFLNLQFGENDFSFSLFTCEYDMRLNVSKLEKTKDIIIEFAIIFKKRIFISVCV